MPNTNSPNPTSEQSYSYHATLDPALASSLQPKDTPDMYNGADPRPESTAASPYLSSASGENNPRVLPPFFGLCDLVEYCDENGR